MNATLTFDEEDELMDAINGYKYKLALWDMNQYLRSEMKYNDNLTTEEYEYAEKIQKKLIQLINDYQITIE